jgi:hypothetical protein
LAWPCGKRWPLRCRSFSHRARLGGKITEGPTTSGDREKGAVGAEEKIEATETIVSSERQIESNKLNARLSTGPRTIAGKQKIATNALKHGLTGKQIVLPDENPDDFDEFSSTLWQDLDPQGTLE